MSRKKSPLRLKKTQQKKEKTCEKSLTCAVKTVKISLRPSGRGPGRVRSNNESTNHTKTDGAGDPPSGERRADRKGDIFAVRDAQLSEVSPTLENRGGGFRQKNLTNKRKIASMRV